jgi:hypothetical protein
MTTGSTSTKRRTFFQRGLALLAGGAALAGTSRWAGAASPPAAALAPQGDTLTLFARSRPSAGHQHGADGRILASGDLLDAPDGNRIGTFYTNCFCVPTPFGPQAAAPSTLEFHVLQLQDGTLFSMGAGGNAADAQASAIIGGTDRFAGRSGAFVQRPIAAAGRDVRELTITFAG